MRPNYDLFINGVEKPNVIWGKNNVRKYNYKLSYELAGSCTLFGADAKEIIDGDITLTYEVLITKNGLQWFTGSFRKIDCDINEDDVSVKVSFKKEDEYTAIDDFKDKEVDIIKDLGVPRSVLTYDTPATVQLYFQHNPKITSVTTSQFTEGDVGAYDDAALVASGFHALALRYLVVADHDTPAAGLYEVKTRLEGLDIHFYGQQIADPSYEIDINAGTIEVGIDVLTTGTDYSGSYTTNPFGDGLPAIDTTDLDTYGFSGENTTILTNVGGDQLKVYCFIIWLRVLTNETTFQGFATTATDNDTDFSPSAYNYQISPDVFGYAGFPFDVSALTAATGDYERPSGLLNSDEDAMFYVDSGYPPMTPSVWQEASLYYQGPIDLSTGNSVITLNHAYKVETILNKWFEWRGKTITVSFPHEVYLVPSTNITVGKYDIAAKKGKTTLSEILEAISGCFRLDYHIDAGIMYFESFNYYENLPIGLDLMSAIEPKSGRSWGYRSKKYTYKKEDIPERLEFTFSTKSSEVFNGRPIIHTSPFVGQGNKKTIQVPYFTDLQWALSNPSDINKDSLIMLYGDGAGGVEYYWVDGVLIQNGGLSWTSIHPRFYKDNAACELLNINDEDTAANSVLKTKVQKVTMPIEEFVPLRSILTSLGDGKVNSINEDMLTGIADIELYHDI